LFHGTSDLTGTFLANLPAIISRALGIDRMIGAANPLAAPGVDADGDGQDNRFEFIAGVIPNDVLSRFEQRLEPVPGQPGQTQVIFSPRLTDRSYTVQTSTTLLPLSWITLTGTTETDDGDERTVTDPDASTVRKFYKVEITRP
jgi:hypothetical protein